jgi:GNAT superfamily N-acetyltransferase
VPTIRAATKNDVDDLVPLWHELEATQGPFRAYPIAGDAESRLLASLRSAVDANDAEVLVAYDGEEPVGMALVRLEHPSRQSDELAVELSRVVVRSDRRGIGAGRALVAAAESWARDRGIRTLVAAIFIANEPSRRFWRAIGFEPWVERMVREVGPG